MSRRQDILGLVRGIQLVAGASVKTQEAYLKHIWSHSSVREAVEKSASQTSECGKKVITNPGKELQNVGNALRETLERSAVVVEGIRRYTAAGRTTYPIGDVEMSKDTRSYSTIKNIKNLDIASITLKELENLLSEHNKLRNVNLRIDDSFKPKSKKSKAQVEAAKTAPQPMPNVAPSPPRPKVEPTQSISNDEKQVEGMLKFITNFDRPETSSSIGDAKSFVPEVSHTKLYFNLSNVHQM